MSKRSLTRSSEMVLFRSERALQGRGNYFQVEGRGANFFLTRTRPGGHICAPPIGFSQIAEKWRRAAPPNLA